MRISDVRLCPGGQISYKVWQPEVREHTLEYLTPKTFDQLASFFWREISIDENFTLGDLFKLVDVQNIHLLEEVTQELIEPYLVEANEPVKERSDLWYLEVCFRGIDSLDGTHIIDTNVSGVGEPTDIDSFSEGNDIVSMSYGIDFVPVNEMLHLPIRFNPVMKFENRDADVSRDSIFEYQTKTGITLLQLIKAFFAEFSYYGLPEQRQQLYEELKRRAISFHEDGEVASFNNLKKGLLEDTNSKGTVTWEELQEEFYFLDEE